MYFDLAYAPYGETYVESGTPDRMFAGMNQDTVQGPTAALYDATFREYAMYGRWISPDPAGLGAVDPGNPQTWNRYAYVMGNPLGLTDPLGLGTGNVRPDFAPRPFSLLDYILSGGSGLEWDEFDLYNIGLEQEKQAAQAAPLLLRQLTSNAIFGRRQEMPGRSR